MSEIGIIPLTQGKFALVDAEDFNTVSKYKWHAHRQPRKKAKDSWEAIGWVEGKPIKMHRFIMGLTSDDKIMIDHINHNGLDNRKENLRLCSNGGNQANQRIIPGSSSSYKGVSWHKASRKWRVSISKNNEKFEINGFVNEIEAAKAYDEKAKELFGNFAQLNF